MLVLKRKKGEKIVIGHDIIVHILDLEGDTVKLGFEAPEHVQIMRSELYETIKAENVQAGKHSLTKEALKDIIEKLLKKSE